MKRELLFTVFFVILQSVPESDHGSEDEAVRKDCAGEILIPLPVPLPFSTYW